MKSIRGGYQLISLGMVALGSLSSLPLSELEKLSNTTKRIVLTDVTLDGSTRLPDIEVQIEKSGTDILLKGIYGKDLKIESDGDVVVSAHGELKLYVHSFVFDNYTFRIISPDKTVSTSNNNISWLQGISTSGAVAIPSNDITRASFGYGLVTYIYWDSDSSTFKSGTKSVSATTHTVAEL